MRCTLLLPGAPLLLTLVPLALAPSAFGQEPDAPLGPEGEYTIGWSYGGATVPGVLTITRDEGALVGRAALEGQFELVFGTVRADDRTVTLSDRVQAADLTLVFRVEPDGAIEGTWTIGPDGGAVTGRRGVDPESPPPACADGPGTLPPASPTPQPTANPDAARIVTSDVALFWEVLDRADDAGALVDALARAFHCDYLREGTDAVRDFIPGRILGGRELAETVMEHRERYEAVRESSLTVAEVEPTIRAAFQEMKALYPEAVFPDVHFVVGRLNTGGMVSQRGLLIGAEMFADHVDIPPLVAHELVHYQQLPIPSDRQTLLAQSVMEGSADFVAELTSGGHINERAHEYALPREAELWEEFAEAMHGRDVTGWLYGNAPAGRPSDLGYFFGYRIAQAYYDRALEEADPNPAASREAVREILTVTDFPDFLERSGYDPLAR